ncbi:MAG: hypothetical protein ACLFV3_05440 [Phycisphaeraceae bacterium]
MKRKRWTSRKFLMALGAQVAAVAVLLWPGQEAAIVEATRAVVSLVVIGLTAMGYIAAEAAVDKARPAVGEQ